jgi:hypothetical protein
MMAPELSDGHAPARSHGRPIDSSKIPYQLPQPMGMARDVLIAGALEPAATNGTGCRKRWMCRSSRYC